MSCQSTQVALKEKENPNNQATIHVVVSECVYLFIPINQLQALKEKEDVYQLP